MKDPTFKDLLLGKESFFWTPDYVDTSAWIEHIPFAFWMIEAAKPKVVVELGVHNGTSYFAFCQAVKKLNIHTVCYGVDTWQGDEHAGFYDEATFAKVTEQNQQRYSRFSTLIRSTFDEAKEYFIDGTIDLLHIDGLHTYEAVKHDFETWLPKLAPNAFVIFHDINVRERNFGVFKFWQELQQHYQNFQFHFGYGLGILTLGKPDNEEFDLLFKQETEPGYYSFLRNLFSDRGSAIKAGFNLARKVKEAIETKEAQALAQTQLEHNYIALEKTHAQLKADFEALTESYQQLNQNVSRLELLNGKAEESNRLLAEIGGKATHMVNTTDLFADMLKTLLQKKDEYGSLKAEKEALQNELAWYKRTYENRSILGVLKSRLKK